MSSPKAKLEDVRLRISREGKDFVVEVRIPDHGVQTTQGRTLRAALLNVADVISLMTEEA